MAKLREGWLLVEVIFVVTTIEVVYASVLPIWFIETKVSSFGDSIKLVCPISNCCDNMPYWIVWSRDLRHEERIIRPAINHSKDSNEVRYKAEVTKEGATLVIQDITRSDLGIPISCSYGKKNGMKRTFRYTEAFVRPNNTRIKFADQIARETTIFGVVCASIVTATLLYLIIRTWRKRLQAKSHTPQ